MEFARREGLEEIRSIGSGGCGEVYRAELEGHGVVAAKRFRAMQIDRPLLQRMTNRLETGGSWPEGVLPVLFADFAARPCYWVTPLIGSEDEQGEVHPANLQTRADEFPGDLSWPVVKSIAAALAEMHQRRVAHANLKPGNVFLTTDDRVLLADWAMGNIAQASHVEFTDALLYQAPEQLTAPGGYGDEMGYRWDVFSFGVLAFRLLTGQFPRCDETFRRVAPGPSEPRRDGVHADLEKIAESLELHGDVVWPDEPANAIEAGYREWIDRCLSLGPQARPADMIQVAAGLDAVERQVRSADERERLLQHSQRVNRRAWQAAFFAGVSLAIAMVFFALWQFTRTRLHEQEADRQVERTSLTEAVVAAHQAQDLAQAAATEAKQTLSYERDRFRVRMEAAKQVGDRLFSWSIEEGHRQLPPLDGREVRLKRLESTFEEFLERTAKIEALEEARAMTRVQLAEIALALGDAEKAAERLKGSIAEWSQREMSSEMQLRMARNRLSLALLRQSKDVDGLVESFSEARSALEAVPKTEVDHDRLTQLLAILDFHEAHWLATHDQEGQALEQLLRATQSLNRLADERPDSAVVRSELAACYLSSATILEGMAKLGDARDVRSLAVRELTRLLKENPGDVSIRSDLAGAYGAMAEAAMLSADVASAEAASEQALALLDPLIRERPDLTIAVARKSAQLGLRAGIERDRGHAEEALKGYNQAIRLLEELRLTHPKDAIAAFRLAALWWQKANLLGNTGDGEKQIPLLMKARELLIQLEIEPNPEGPRPEKIQTTLAYLLGDLGHAQQLEGELEQARETFTESRDRWSDLLTSRPQSEEFQEALSWVKGRLDDLK